MALARGLPLVVPGSLSAAVTGVACPLPALSAWLRQRCCWGDMAGAFMQYDLVRVVTE